MHYWDTLVKVVNTSRHMGQKHEFFSSFLTTPQPMAFPGQGSDPSHSRDLHHSCGNARSVNPLCRVRNWTGILVLQRYRQSRCATVEAPAVILKRKKVKIMRLSFHNFSFSRNYQGSKNVLRKHMKKKQVRTFSETGEFPGGLGVRIQHSHCCCPGLIPGLGTEIQQSSLFTWWAKNNKTATFSESFKMWGN